MKRLIMLSLTLASCSKDLPRLPESKIEPVSLGCSIVYDQPGTYVLDRDIESKTCGIEVKASGVTVDLNGHRIQGPSDLMAVNYGVYSVDKSDVKIMNGFIDGFSFGVALTSSNGIGNKVRNNQVFNMVISNSSLKGIQIHGYNGRADANKIRESGGNLSYPDAFGFGIEMLGPDCMVSNNEVIDTYGTFNNPGTYIAEGVAISFSFYSTNCVAAGNVIHNNRAVTNKSTFGFWVDVYSVVTIRNNTVSGMHYSGIVPPRTIQINNTTDIPFSDGCYDRN